MSEKKLEELNYYILTRARARAKGEEKEEGGGRKGTPRRKLHARIDPYPE